jgi:hypothetical protein
LFLGGQNLKISELQGLKKLKIPQGLKKIGKILHAKNSNKIQKNSITVRKNFRTFPQTSEKKSELPLSRQKTCASCRAGL